MGSVGTSKNTASAYDYSQGDIQDAVNKFQDATGVKVNPALLSKVHPDNLKMVMSSLHQLIDTDKVTLTTLSLYNTTRPALAGSNGSEILLNPKYFGLTPEQLAQVYQKSVDDGFHPQGTNSSHIVTHELGHNAMSDLIKKNIPNTGFMSAYDRMKEWDAASSWSKKSIAKSLIMQAAKNAGVKGAAQKTAETISGYAAKSPAETIAEAYADYKANGSNAKPLSIELYKLLF